MGGRGGSICDGFCDVGIVIGMCGHVYSDGSSVLWVYNIITVIGWTGWLGRRNH